MSLCFVLPSIMMTKNALESNFELRLLKKILLFQNRYFLKISPLLFFCFDTSQDNSSKDSIIAVRAVYSHSLDVYTSSMINVMIARFLETFLSFSFIYLKVFLFFLTLAEMRKGLILYIRARERFLLINVISVDSLRSTKAIHVLMLCLL